MYAVYKNLYKAIEIKIFALMFHFLSLKLNNEWEHFIKPNGIMFATMALAPFYEDHDMFFLTCRLMA